MSNTDDGQVTSKVRLVQSMLAVHTFWRIAFLDDFAVLLLVRDRFPSRAPLNQCPMVPAMAEDHKEMTGHTQEKITQV